MPTPDMERVPVALYLRSTGASDEPAIPLTRFPLLVGRHPSADILLASKTSNRRHAVLVWQRNRLTIYDLNSVNGLRVNDKRCAACELAPGDRLKIGNAEYLMEAEGDEPIAPDPAANKPGSASEICRIEFLLDSQLKRIATVERKAVIGYASRCQIQLEGGGVSSLHCILVHEDGIWYLHDLKSEQGIVHNGLATRSTTVEDGDVVEIGDYHAVFHLADDWEPGNPADESEAPSMPTTDEETDELMDTMAVEEEEDAKDEGTLLHTESPDPRVEEITMIAEQSAREQNPMQAIASYMQACGMAPFVLRVRKRLRALQGEAVGCGPKDRPRAGMQLRLFRFQVKAGRLYRRGELLKALEAAEAGLCLDPWNKALLLIQARIFERFNRLEHCIWTLMTARRRDPLDPDLTRPLARIMFHIGKYDESVRFWKLVAQADPSDRDIERRIKEAQVQKSLIVDDETGQKTLRKVARTPDNT